MTSSYSTCAHLRTTCAVKSIIAQARSPYGTRTYVSTCANLRDVAGLRARGRACVRARARDVAIKTCAQVRAGALVGWFPHARKSAAGPREQPRLPIEFVYKPVRFFDLESNDVKPQDLQRKASGANLLSKSLDCDRLFRVMARWWNGATWAQIADAEGISRQRVGRLLASVGCSRALRRKANRTRRDSGLRALPARIADARDALMHPRARRLTVRQRAALAWLAQGLRQSNIARRMVTTPQNVRNLLVAARWRLERLSRPKRRKRAGQRLQRGGCDMVQPASDVGISIEWDRLLDGIDAPRSQVNKREGNCGTARGSLAGPRHVGTRRARGVRGRHGGVAGTSRRPKRWSAHGRTGRDDETRWS